MPPKELEIKEKTDVSDVSNEHDLHSKSYNLDPEQVFVSQILSGEFFSPWNMAVGITERVRQFINFIHTCRRNTETVRHTTSLSPEYFVSCDIVLLYRGENESFIVIKNKCSIRDFVTFSAVDEVACKKMAPTDKRQFLLRTKRE